MTGYTSGYTSKTQTCNQSFGERLKSLRLDIGLSQKELSKRLGLSLTSIQNYEQGGYPRGDISIKLADFFQCSIDWLLTGRQPESLESQETPQEEPETQEQGQSEEKPSISELLTKTAEVLESNTVYSNALSANIKAFHEAAQTEKKLQELQQSMDEKFQQLEDRINELEKENSDLKKRLEDTSRAGTKAAANED